MSTTSTTSNLSLTGLGTGIDWQSIVSELSTAAEEELVPDQQEVSAYNTQISAWGTISSELGSLQTASNSLSSATAFDQYSTNVTSNTSTSASSLLTATASSSASTGTYTVAINSIAQAEQLASNEYSSETSALGISGEFLINDQLVSVSASDSLENLQSKISDLDTGSNPSGVTASIVGSSSNGYQLVLTSDTTGASGISLLNGDNNNVLESLGFNGSGSATVKNQITGGAQSDSFASSSTAVDSLLGVTSRSGTVTINGKSVTINLDDSLQGIESALNAAGLSASIVSSNTDSSSSSDTTYQLQIAGGLNSFTDSNNVLQTLGFIQGDRTSQTGVSGSTANTSDGSTPITSSSLITGIYGYNQYTSGDSITISGTNHSGSTVSSTLQLTSTSTVGDLLNQIDSTFGNVTASVTSNGKIQVVDNDTGTSKLSLSLTSNIQDANSTLSFGSFGTVGTVRQYVLQQGADASFTVDGESLTSSSNTVTSAISGVTLNLLASDPNTTLSVNVSHDTTSIENEVTNMITAYNTVMNAINVQNTYNSTTSTTGGPLFGDPVLQTLKSQLESTILEQIGTGTYNSLPSIGITIGSNGTVDMDTTAFQNALSSNFQEVSSIFQDSGTTSNSLFKYSSNTSATKSGTYNVDLSSDSSGTIDGQTAKVSSGVASLSGSTSGANGLVVSYSGSSYPATASVTISRGLASLLNDMVNSFTNSTNGVITTEDSGINSSITQLTDQENQMQANITQQMSSLNQEYENMNTTVAQLDTLQSYLSAELATI